MIAHTAAVKTQLPDTVTQSFVIRHDRAAVTKCPQVFGRIKGKASDIPECSGHLSVPVRSMGLGTVLDQFQFMFFADLLHPAHLCRLSVQMYHHHGFGLFRDRRFDLLRIDHIIFVRFYKHRCAAGHRDAHDTGNKGIGLYDHLITGADPQRPAGQIQRIQTVAETHTVFCSHIRRVRLLKGLQLLPQDIPSRAQHPKRRRFKLFLISVKSPVQPVRHNTLHTILPFRKNSRLPPLGEAVSEAD